MCSFSMGNIKGTNSSKTVVDVCVCVLFYVSVGIGIIDRKGLSVYEKTFEMYICL